MPKITMLKVDWWKEAKARAKPKHITWEAQELLVEVDFDKTIYNLFGSQGKGKNDDLDTKVSEGGRAVYGKFLDNVVGHVKWADALLDKHAKAFQKDKDVKKYNMELTRVEQGFTALMQNEAKDIEKKIEKGVTDAFDKWKKTKSDYKKYKARAAAKIALKIGSMGFAVAKLVGTSGADVLAWRGLIKDSVKTVTELAKLKMDAESFRKATETQLNKVLDWHKKLGDGKAATGSEIGLALLKTAIGTDAEMTLDAVGANVKQYKSKLLKVKEKAQALGEKLAKTQNSMDEAKGLLPADLAKEFEPMEKSVDDLIKQLVTTNEKAAKGDTWAGNMDKLIAELKKAKSVSDAGKCVKAMDSISDIITGGLSWKKLADDSSKAATTISKQAVTLGKNIERWWDEAKKLGKAA